LSGPLLQFQDVIRRTPVDPWFTRSSPKCSLSKNIARFARLEFAVPLHLDAELLNEPLRRVAVRKRRRDAHRPAIADERTGLEAELVPLGVSAEVVVVVEDKNLLRHAERAPPEMGAGKPRDAGLDDDEVVRFAGSTSRPGNCRYVPRCIGSNPATASGWLPRRPVRAGGYGAAPGGAGGA